MTELYSSSFIMNSNIIPNFTDFKEIFKNSVFFADDICLVLVEFPGEKRAILRLTDCGEKNVHASIFGAKNLEAFLLFLDWLVFIFKQNLNN